LKSALEALCASELNNKALQVEQRFHVRLRSLRLLSSCRVDGERFGRLEHFSRLLQKTRAPNIVLYISADEQFFVVSAKRSLTQPVDTRSAMCWLRQGAGLGFLFDEERGLFGIEASRNFLSDDADPDPWSEGLAHLLSSLSVVFPACTFSSEDAEEGQYAVACKDAEQSDLSTDAGECEDAEEEAKEMLDFNALD
jgi:hypothetical protein